MKTSKLLLAIIALFALSITSCVSIKSAGSLNMVSTRNIETTSHYVMIQQYVSLSKKEIKRTKAETAQQAIDEVVKKVSGGEYLMNTRVYLIVHHIPFLGTSYKYAVEGDVWGKK